MGVGIGGGELALVVLRLVVLGFECFGLLLLLVLLLLWRWLVRRMILWRWRIREMEMCLPRMGARLR